MTLTATEDRNVTTQSYCLATDQFRSNWIVDASEAFKRLFRLPSNWDGQGGPSPDGEVLVRAWRLLERLSRADCPRPTAINPTPTGGIQIEWEQGQKYFEVEFVPDSIRMQVFASDEESGREQEIEVEPQDVFGLVLKESIAVGN